MTDFERARQDVATAADFVSWRMLELSKCPTEGRVAETVAAFQVAVRTVNALAHVIGNLEASHEE